MPAFYHRPASIDEMVDQTVERVIDLFALGAPLAAAWGGTRGTDDGAD
jgi:4-hydroxy-3-polyprenylbenzoate decarboxylase